MGEAQQFGCGGKLARLVVHRGRELLDLRVEAEFV